MSKDARMKWVDPRVPVSVEQIGKFKVSIYDMNAYLQSKLDYPDDPNVGADAKFQASSNRSKPFAKKKPAARWNWVVKLEQPLGKVAQEKGQTA